MQTELKVTDTPEESCFNDIVAGDNVINIPLFQREYKWGKTNLENFWNDISDIIDGTKKSQFLGVIVTVPQNKQLGRPTIFDIVDGQQRLFTSYIIIMASVKVALDCGEIEWAKDVSRSYLLLRQFSNYPTNTKLIPSALDRQQFRMMWDEISNHKSILGTDFWTMIGKPTPPASSGTPNGKLIAQYRRIINDLKEYSIKGFDIIKNIIEIIALRLSFVSISLRDPIAAPIIFERLNARSEKITTADLVRNEIFAKVAHDPTSAQVLFNNYWQPFALKYKEREIDIEKLLFPYGLMHDNNTTKADLFTKLRVKWANMSGPEQIISDLDRFTDILFALETGDRFDRHNAQFAEILFRFHSLGAPSSIYSFVFALIDSADTNIIPNSVDILETLESFLVRRAVCGYEPTGLHAVFKNLYSDVIKY